MLMPLANGKLVVCLEVGGAYSFCVVERNLDFYLGRI